MEWVARKLDWTRTLRPWMPDGFERYVRVLHPAFVRVSEEEKGVREISVPWSTVGEWSGKPVNATSHIQDLMLRADGITWTEQGREGLAPSQGQMDSESLGRLLTHVTEETTTPNEIWMLIWTGYGGPPDVVGLPVEVSWFLGATGRHYVLRRGSILSTPDGPDGPAFENPPTFWWPADRSWFVVCDLDAASTYVGGSQKLIQRILRDTSLEVFPAQLDDPYDGLFVSNAIVENAKSRVEPRNRLRHHLHHFRFRFGHRPSSGQIQFRKKRFWKW